MKTPCVGDEIKEIECRLSHESRMKLVQQELRK